MDSPKNNTESVKCAKPSLRGGGRGCKFVSHLLVVGLLSLLSMLGAPAFADPGAQRETMVRAAFLYRLSFFLTWPGAAFLDDESPVILCVLDQSGSGIADVLREQTATRTVNERQLKVIDLATGQFDGQMASQCHVLYLATTDRLPAQRWLKQLNTQHTLIVVNSLDKLRTTGEVALVLEQTGDRAGRLVFYAHRDRLRDSDIRVSAKLLQIVRFYESRG